MDDVTTISLREFQRNGAKYIEKLPVALTQYGKLVAYVVVPVDDGDPEENVPTPVDTKSTIEELKQTIPGFKTANELTTQNPIIDEVAKSPWGNPGYRCQFCGVSPAILMQYDFDDGSGEGTGYFCKKHADEYDKKKNDEWNQINGYTVRQDINVGGAKEFLGPIPKPEKKKKEK